MYSSVLFIFFFALGLLVDYGVNAIKLCTEYISRKVTKRQTKCFSVLS